MLHFSAPWLRNSVAFICGALALFPAWLALTPADDVSSIQRSALEQFVYLPIETLEHGTKQSNGVSGVDLRRSFLPFATLVALCCGLLLQLTVAIAMQPTASTNKMHGKLQKLQRSIVSRAGNFNSSCYTAGMLVIVCFMPAWSNLPAIIKSRIFSIVSRCQACKVAFQTPQLLPLRVS
jgi:hypothetical protein